MEGNHIWLFTCIRKWLPLSLIFWKVNMYFFCNEAQNLISAIIYVSISLSFWSFRCLNKQPFCPPKKGLFCLMMHIFSILSTSITKGPEWVPVFQYWTTSLVREISQPLNHIRFLMHLEMIFSKRKTDPPRKYVCIMLEANGKNNCSKQ